MTESQRNILRDMAGGAQIEYQHGTPPISPPAAFVAGRQIDLTDFRELCRSGCIYFTIGELGYYRLYALTPAGAAAAGAGA